MTRRVLITAGASGIGLVMARSFAASGARVWVSDVDAGALSALPAGMRGSRVDVADEGAMSALRAGYAQGTALFLASNAARMVSGQALAVDAFTINPDPQV